MLGKGLQLKTTALLVFFLYLIKAVDRVWYTGLLHKLKCYGISGQVVLVVLDGKSSQEYPVNARVPPGFSLGLGPTLSLLYINDLPVDFICNIAVCADDTTLYS